MKATFKYGIKGYSGTFDSVNYANYKRSGVVIARMLPADREITEHNVSMGEKAKKISTLYVATSDAYKKDLAGYSKKMFRLKPFKNKIAGNGYSVFIKMLWAAAKDSENPLDLGSLSVDDLQVDAYTQISSVKIAVENGFLPKVANYEVYNSAIN